MYPYDIAFSKLNSRWIEGLNLKKKAMKLLDKNTDKCIYLTTEKE